MKGYYNDEVQTERKLKGGYLHTGDYGRINSSGRLVITKRNPAIISLPTGEKYAEMS